MTCTKYATQRVPGTSVRWEIMKSCHQKKSMIIEVYVLQICGLLTTGENLQNDANFSQTCLIFANSKFETVIYDKEFGSKIIKTLRIRCRLKIVHKWPQKVLQYSYISKKCHFEYACCYFGCFAPSHLKLEKLLRGVHFSFSIEDKIFCKKCLSQIGGCRPTWDESFQFSGLCNA